MLSVFFLVIFYRFLSLIFLSQVTLIDFLFFYLTYFLKFI